MSHLRILETSEDVSDEFPLFHIQSAGDQQANMRVAKRERQQIVDMRCSVVKA